MYLVFFGSGSSQKIVKKNLITDSLLEEREFGNLNKIQIREMGFFGVYVYLNLGIYLKLKFVSIANE